MHDQKSIYGKKHLDDTTHERTIIFRQLFSGEVLGSRIKKTEEKRAGNVCEKEVSKISVV